MNLGQHLVLVADDDLAVRDSLKFSLELEGLTVHTCSGGAELLIDPHLADAECLVLDDQMPSMNGFEVIAQLKARNCRVPVILITGYATSAFRRRATIAGVRHVIEKPLLDSALIEGIRDVLGRLK